MKEKKYILKILLSQKDNEEQMGRKLFYSTENPVWSFFFIYPRLKTGFFFLGNNEI